MIKDIDKEKGVSLIITFFVMIIILAVVLSISIILYGEAKVLRNVGDSMVGLYAADSGIEKVLYYDRQVKPSNGAVCSTNSDCTDPSYPACNNQICTAAVQRGLCSMLDSTDYDNSCAASGPRDSSVYCSVGVNATAGSDCDPKTCTNCSITFSTDLDDGINYYTTAKVYPGTSASEFEVDSKGTYNSVGRQIQILITTKNTQ